MSFGNEKDKSGNVLRYGRKFLELIFRQKRDENATAVCRRPAYQPPRLNKLTPEQAKLKLLGNLSVGDQGAKELLDLCFPEPDVHHQG